LDQFSGASKSAVIAKFHEIEGLTSSAAELNVLDAVPAAITFAHAAGASNIVNLSFTARDAAGNAMTKPTFIDVWLSDAADGLAITSHVADTITASAGSVWHVNTAAASLRVQTNSAGLATLVVTDTHKTAFYVCAALGIDPRPNLIHLLAGGDYGA
jgi:hypothetical protein